MKTLLLLFLTCAVSCAQAQVKDSLKWTIKPDTGDFKILFNNSIIGDRIEIRGDTLEAIREIMKSNMRIYKRLDSAETLLRHIYKYGWPRPYYRFETKEPKKL